MLKAGHGVSAQLGTRHKPVHLVTSRMRPARPPHADSAQPVSRLPTDGRLQRSFHTRRRIVETMIGICHATGIQPTMAEVARGAGISLRALFVHFPDLETLIRAGSVFVRAIIEGVTENISPDAPLDQRIAAYAQFRADFFVAMGKIWRTGYVLAQSFPEVQANRLAYRAGERARLGRIFATELDPLTEEQLGQRLAALTAVADFHYWENLGEMQQYTVEQSKTVIADTLLAILKQPPGGGAA